MYREKAWCCVQREGTKRRPDAVHREKEQREGLMLCTERRPGAVYREKA